MIKRDFTNIRLIYIMQEYSQDVGGWALHLFNELSKYIDVTILARPYKHSIKAPPLINLINPFNCEIINPRLRIMRYEAKEIKGILFPDKKYFFDILDGLGAIDKFINQNGEVYRSRLVVQMDEYFKPYSLLAMKWCNKNKVPYIISSRMRYRPGLLKNFALWCFKILAKKHVLRAKKIIATQGKCSQIEFSRWFPSFPSDMFENIPSGIKIENQYRRIDRKKDNIILAVSRIYPIKRIDLLLKVFSDVVKYTDAELWIIGKEEKQEFIKLQNLLKLLIKDNPRLIDKRGEMRVKFLGGIENKELYKYYSKAKLLVNTSETEGICFSFLEAMMHKLPIVAWDVGGNNGVVENRYNGYLYKFGDIERMSLGIQRILSNTDKHNSLRIDMGQKGFDKLKKQFNIQINAKKYLEVYRGIL